MPMLMKNGFATIGVVLASALSSFVFGASPSAAQVNCSRVLDERCSQTYRVDAGNATHTSQGKKEAENEVTVPSGYVVVNFREINESSQTGGGTFNVSFAARGTISNVVRQYASESSRVSDYKAKVDALYQGSQGSEKAKLDILRNQLNALSSAASTSSSVNTNTDVFTLRATSQYQCTRMVFGECVDGRGGHGKGSLIVDLVFVGDNPSAMLDSIGQQLAAFRPPIGYEDLTRQLYRQILGREPEPNGFRDNVNAMRQHGFEWVRAGIAGSQESRNNINNMYRQYLCRDADSSGMNHHINLLASGQMALDQIRNGIANGAEAQQHRNGCR